MGFARDGSIRQFTVIIGIGIAIFSFGLCLLIFGRAYAFDSTHHDLFLAFGCVFMIPGAAVVAFGCIQLLRIYLFSIKEEGMGRMEPNYQAPMPAESHIYQQDDVFMKSESGKADFVDQGHARSTYYSGKSVI